MTAAAIHPRIALLRALVARQGGEWTPARVARAYAAKGIDAPKRTTHRDDLHLLHRLGDLDVRETAGRRCYVPSRRHTDRGTNA